MNLQCPVPGRRRHRRKPLQSTAGPDNRGARAHRLQFQIGIPSGDSGLDFPGKGAGIPGPFPLPDDGFEP